MKKYVKKTVKTFLCILCASMLLFGRTVDVFAINTKFDVPTIEQDWTPDNCLYKSPNLNIMVCNWGYGLVADVLNTSSVDTLLAELHANISPAGYSRSILGIYMEGAGLSAANASAIANAGWTEVELYYENFLVAGSAPTGAMTPSVAMTTDKNAMAILAGAGIAEDVAMIKVSDVNMTWANFILYEPEFKFLKGKSLHSYKYIPDLGVFVSIAETYFGTYGANFLELYDLQKAEADVNGIYVTLTKALPDDLVVSAEQVPTLRENLTVTSPADTVPDETSEDSGDTELSGEDSDTDPVAGGSESNVPLDEENEPEETVEKEETEQEDNIRDSATQVSGESGDSSESGQANDSQGAEEEHVEAESTGETDDTTVLLVSNTEATVEWKFADGLSPKNFTAEATIQAISETEISVDFAYAGALPQNTEVTVQVPSESVNYQEGDTLYLYFCNPQTNQREFVSEGTYQGKQVTFKIYHCSEYVITSTAPDGTGEANKGMPMWPLVVLLGAVVSGIVGFMIVKKKDSGT